jgi:hypothetical protein
MNTDLQTIAKSLRAYAMARPLDVLKGQAPYPEHYRHLTLNDHPYRICFTYQVTGEIKALILSVYDLKPLADRLPDEVVSKQIADAIFGIGNYQDGQALNVLKVSRKYLQLL